MTTIIKKKSTDGSLFISRFPFKRIFNNSFVNFINRVIFFFTIRYKIHPLPDPMLEMNTMEQRINLFHLLKSVIDFNVPGEVAEFGCYTGQCAIIFQKVVSDYDDSRKVILYDSFEAVFSSNINVEQELKKNFEEAGLKQPVLVKGKFEETIPEELPYKIAFAHIDCGGGHEVKDHSRLVGFLLNAIYPHLSKGAVVFLMDYHDREKGHDGTDFHPGVKIAADDFLADKEETIIPLYGNQLPAGYFRKL